jgi:hypothetical protein
VHLPRGLHLLACACLSVATPALAQSALAGRQTTPPAPGAEPDQPGVVSTPSDVSGRLRPASEPGDQAREVAGAVLLLPRTILDVLYVTTGAAAGLIEDEQVVPRLKDTFFTEDHQVGLFPTAFVETGFAPNVGARMIAKIDNFASTIRAGYGGPDTNIIESRLRLTTVRLTPVVFGLEGLYDRRTDLGYQGVGPQPGTDERNSFRATTGLRSGLYREVRRRVIASVGFRAMNDIEVLFSSSYKRRDVDDAPGAGVAGLSQVFEPSTVPGAQTYTRSTYSEAAVRVDTRVSRGAPATGAMVESYAGLYKGVGDTDGDAMGAGARWAAFIPVYRVTNVISPRIAIDGILPLGDKPLTFNDYVMPGDYRGFDARRDCVVMVASLDYRWTLMQFIAARMFGDAANVAPDLQSLGIDNLKLAWGFGFDLHTSTTELARIAASFSDGGGRLFFSLGVASSGFGDRQHR